MLDSVWSGILSDLFVNLAAGWFGAVIIVPNFVEGKGKRKLLVLTTDVLLCIVSLATAFILKRPR